MIKAELKSTKVYDDHQHCPLECEHPQPFILDGKMFCGRCYFKDCIETEMIPCTPAICGEAS